MLKKLGLIIVVVFVFAMVYLMRTGVPFGAALAEIGMWVMSAATSFVDYISRST